MKSSKEITKSSKGKTPVGGKTKRVTVVPHGARKQKPKDPVEVREKEKHLPPSFIARERTSLTPSLSPGLLQGAAAQGRRGRVMHVRRQRQPTPNSAARELSGVQVGTEEPSQYGRCSISNTLNINLTPVCGNYYA